MSRLVTILQPFVSRKHCNGVFILDFPPIRLSFVMICLYTRGPDSARDVAYTFPPALLSNNTKEVFLFLIEVESL